jgi:hypothetical protein
MVVSVTADLTLRFHDAYAVDAPAEWTDFLRTGDAHSLWHWSVVHAAAVGRRGRTLAGTFHDGDTVVGIVVARLRGLSAGSPLVTVADVDCPSSAAMPGIVLRGGLPPGLGPAAPGADLSREAVRAFEDAMRARFGRRVPLVWYRQMFTESMPVVLDRSVAMTYAGAPVSVFRNQYDDFDTYLRTLTKSRRGDVRRIGRILDEDPTLTIRFDDKPDGLDLRAAERLMIETAMRNQHARFPPRLKVPSGVRDALATAPGTQVMRYTYEDGGLLGCGLIYDHPVMPVHGQWGGREATKPGGRSGLWFDQMIRTMRWTVEAGHAGLIGGKGLNPLKAEFGFTSVPQWTVVRRLA